MCGILGVYDSSGVNKSRFTESLSKLYHRGPDNQGEKEINKKLFFGHTRLSIIDLDSSSNQPFFEDENYILTYNGEIFNYLELKEKLKLKGCIFKTNGDTEVVLKSYIFWGEKCVERFNGMWAFAIYDKIKNQIFCSRDRYGIKPFYYTFDRENFIFSSMINSIITYDESIKSPNQKIINEFLYRGLNAQFKETWFKNIFKLKPGFNLIYNFKDIQLKEYYKKRFKRTKEKFNESKTKVRELIENSIDLRLRSDVEIASTLTTGIDSTSIAVISSNKVDYHLKTFTAYSKKESFTVNDKKDFNSEVDLDESISSKYFKNNNMIFNQLEVKNDSYLKELQEAIYYLESGHASPAIVPIRQIYREVNLQNIKVLFEGQGADEVFGGYITDLFFAKLWDEIKKFKNVISSNKLLFQTYSFKRLLIRGFNSFKTSNIFLSAKMFFSKTNISKEVEFLKPIKFQNILDYQQSEILPNLLHYGDSLSMSFSVEVRLPFLDYRLVEYANSLPINYKIRNDIGKYILRKSVKDLLPKEIYESKNKIGFAIPIDNIMKHSSEIKKLLYSNIGGEYFDQKKLNSLLDRYYNNSFNNENFIFKILTIKIWFKTFIE
jgi:asparagine synthase (glutamine-hydrolysing)